MTFASLDFRHLPPSPHFRTSRWCLQQLLQEWPSGVGQDVLGASAHCVVCAHMHIYIHIYIHTYIHYITLHYITLHYIHTYIQYIYNIYIYMYIHIYIYVYTYIYIQYIYPMISPWNPYLPRINPSGQLQKSRAVQVTRVDSKAPSSSRGARSTCTSSEVTFSWKMLEVRYPLVMSK